MGATNSSEKREMNPEPKSMPRDFGVGPGPTGSAGFNFTNTPRGFEINKPVSSPIDSTPVVKTGGQAGGTQK